MCNIVNVLCGANLIEVCAALAAVVEIDHHAADVADVKIDCEAKQGHLHDR